MLPTVMTADPFAQQNRSTGPGQLFAAFERVSETPMTFSYMRQSSCLELHKRGFTPADVELVYRFVKAMLAKGKCNFNELSLNFGPLMGEPDKFEDKLNAAKQWRRPAQPGTRAKAAPAPEVRADPALFEQGRAAMAATRKALLGQ